MPKVCNNALKKRSRDVNNRSSMANWFKDEIEHLGTRLDKTILLAGTQAEDKISRLSEELHAQRKFTAEDIERLIDYAADRFGSTIDSRIEKLRNETSALINQKIEHIRNELASAASEQKRVALRNAAIAVLASIAVGVVSLFYRKYGHGELELVDVFRSLLLALAAGHGLWLAFRLFSDYLITSRIRRNAVIVGLRYFDVLRPKGAWGQLTLFAVLVIAWFALSYSSILKDWLQHLW